MGGGLMRTEPNPDEVRSLVVRIFKDLRAPFSYSLDVHETVVVSGGEYTARCYRAGELYAIWLVDDGIVQFHDADGAILRSINLLEEKKPERLAA
jgi:hypothetical protein